MSFNRPRRSLPSLPTSLTNPSGCPAEFKQSISGRLSPSALQGAGGRLSPSTVQVLFSPVSDHGRMSPIGGRRSASPVTGQRHVSPSRSPSRSPPGLKHQPSGFGGYVGRLGPGMSAMNLSGRRPSSTSCSLDSSAQHKTLRRHHSSGCTSVSSPSYCYLNTPGPENTLKHQNSCPGNLGDDGNCISLYHSPHRCLHSAVSSSNHHSSCSIRRSSGSLQHSSSQSDSDDTDLDAAGKPTSGRSSIYIRGAGLVHQGSIPCSHPHRKSSESELYDSNCCICERRLSITGHMSDQPSQNYMASCCSSRRASCSRTLPESLSPKHLSPSSSQATLHVDDASLTPTRSVSYMPYPSGPTASLSPPRSPHPPLQRNESMVYEEDVPVIVRRRGCMLRVRITSFVDADEDDPGELVTPVPVSI